MLVYDEKFPLLDEKFKGDEVVIQAARGGKVDKHFRRNYALAKHLADRGVVKKIFVRVGVNRDSWVHTVTAATSALSGRPLHWAAAFVVDAEVKDIGSDKLEQILTALDELGVEPAPKAPVKAPAPAQVKPAPKQESKSEEKDGKDGE
ncbi:holin [Mycobacterium phage CicholasNage]|uniref:Uncharacterized protein n=1 Tax=Mycobacterium phage CicholasNage TaxID=2500799 RepID=A0A411BPD0_9CAUD|nr:holin [Mycobacterium phage CicholasNage]QAY03454.1 hypothetical protein SEA_CICHOLASNAGE_27 [Mycobacterium phage CicholasNage]